MSADFYSFLNEAQRRRCVAELDKLFEAASPLHRSLHWNGWALRAGFGDSGKCCRKT